MKTILEMLQDANMFWDFISLRPETTHQTMITFSDRGIPDGYRYMHGFGSHTFKMVNHQHEAVYVKFHYKVQHKLNTFSSLTVVGHSTAWLMKLFRPRVAIGLFHQLLGQWVKYNYNVLNLHTSLSKMLLTYCHQKVHILPVIFRQLRQPVQCAT